MARAETYHRTSPSSSRVRALNPGRPVAQLLLVGGGDRAAVRGRPGAVRAARVLWFRYPNPIDEFSAMSPAGGGKAGPVMRDGGSGDN